MASLSWWKCVWASSRSWWWTGKSGVLPSMGSQRVRHNWATELNTKVVSRRAVTDALSMAAFSLQEQTWLFVTKVTWLTLPQKTEWTFSKKNRTITWIHYPTSGYLSKKPARTCKDMQAPMFPEGLFITATIWKQPVSTNTRVDKDAVYKHTHNGSVLSLTKDATSPFATTWTSRALC